jgi:hypothetical protein
MASAGFLFILRESWRTSAETTPIFSQLMFRAVHWAARRGPREEERFSSEAKKLETRHTGIRRETYAYSYLRRPGYVFVARNTLHAGSRSKSISSVTVARRWHSWK